MRTTAIHGPAPLGNILSVIAAPFRAIGRFLVSLAEAGPRMDAVRQLNAMSDAELAARGLTREGEVRRIFGDYYHL